MANFQSFLKDIKSRITETTVDEIKHRPPKVLIDVRDGGLKTCLSGMTAPITARSTRTARGWSRLIRSTRLRARDRAARSPAEPSRPP